MIYQKPKLQGMRLPLIFLLIIVFLACPGDLTDPEPGNPISNTQFTFHQDVNKLYFGAGAEPTYNFKSLTQLSLHWYGTDKNNTPDSLTLVDDGTSGDIIFNDDLYAIKIANNTSDIMNVLGDDSGMVYLDVIADYGSEKITVTDSFRIGNIIPRIVSVTAPDTIVRPSGSTVSLHLITAEVFDADGLETIKWVGFISYHVDGDSLMNKGNYIYLYDDGSQDILYEPDFTSGDSIRGDGLYSFMIPVYGSGFTDPDFQTKTGSFLWRFVAQDRSDDYSKVKEHALVIE